MLVKEWMSSKVITVEESDSLSDAINTLKRNKIRRMPVMRGDELVGIVSDRDLKEASPSKATSLDIWELHYLMSKIKVKDVMTPNPITIHPDETIERAAMIMHDRKIGGLPVLDDNQKLVGIITEQDIFEALINITGARDSRFRVCVMVPDEPGTIKDVCEVMRQHSFKCVSILTTHHGAPEGKRKVVVRFQADQENVQKIVNDLQSRFGEVLFTEDKE